VIFLEIKELLRLAFRLRKSIDTLEDGQKKRQLAKQYAKIIWQIKDCQTDRYHKIKTTACA